MQKSSKYIGIIIGLLTFVVLTSGCTSLNIFKNASNDFSANDTSYNITPDISIKKFSAYGVSFKYPSSWDVIADNTSGSNTIFASKDVSFNNVQLQVQLIPNNGMSEQDVIKQFHESVTPGWSKNASYMIKIDNKTAYEDIYLVNDTHFSKLMRFANIYLIKNDKTYLITLQAPNNEFDKEKANFAVILNSFKA
ncbi:PsbP-related protein [Methanobacterium oryzae]|uniref:PsbP-related protein n=1 Tax=Methanobacterium oryzae TaxID=69540 RepID=UPI003D2467AA